MTNTGHCGFCYGKKSLENINPDDSESFGCDEPVWKFDKNFLIQIICIKFR